MDNHIHRQRFALANTHDDFYRELIEGNIAGCDIVFITESGNKDIYTHGTFMLDEIKEDIVELEKTVDNHEKRISSNEEYITNLLIAITGFNTRISNLERTYALFEKRITNVEESIKNINKEITNIKNEIDNINNEITNINNEITNLGDDITNIKIKLGDSFDATEINRKLVELENNKANKIHNHTVSDITDFPKFKTINGESIIGSGDITIKSEGSSFDPSDIENKLYWKLNNTTLSPINDSYEVSAKTFYASSDINLKENIISISDEDILKVNNVELVSYNFKEDSTKQYGVIAQLIEEVGLENLIINGEHKSVNYISLLILEIQSLKNQIKELNEKVG